MELKIERAKIAVIGLGYVGLPLAVEFAKRFEVCGFDINSNRVAELKDGFDRTHEVEESELRRVLKKKNNAYKSACASGLKLESDLNNLIKYNTYIISVPTPVDANKSPDLSPLINSSKAIASILNRGDVVIYESTVYPGVTEEICVPILQEISQLTYNEDFFVGYSPERINPGDKINTLTNIKKVTSGSNSESARYVNSLYESIITAGTHLAPSIKVAEAAKVIENSQRDINIAFVNELAKIFNLMGIDTLEVLEAAGTKWNFLPFKPGLVGGHCIGVDPYYLAQKAQRLGYNPEIILAGRRMNDSMGPHIAKEVVKGLIKKGSGVKSAKVLVLGFTFKENCPDIRNTRVIDLIEELKSFGIDVDVCDPIADKSEVLNHYNLSLVSYEDSKINLVKKGADIYDAAVLAVSHSTFESLNEIKLDKNVFVYDAKGFLDKDKVTARL